MCIYHTFHWTCCPGACAPAPYYLHQICPIAEKPRATGIVKVRVKKCKIEHRILDGADYDEPCPRCGLKSSDLDNEREVGTTIARGDEGEEPVSCT